MNKHGPKHIRITVVGDGDTGKTCMLIVYKDKKYEEYYIPTVFDSYSMNIEINQKEYVVVLFDTAGQEEYDKLRKLAYTDTDVFIICFSVDDKNSFSNVLEKWAPEIKFSKPEAKLILVGTKCDLRQCTEKCVKRVDGENLCKIIKADKYLECSSKYMFNVDTVFQEALRSYVRAHDSYRSRKKNACVLL